MHLVKRHSTREQAVTDTVKSVSFVVPACNEEQHLERCLQSILRQGQDVGDDVSVSLVVVDNASTDATVEIASRCGAQVAHVVPGNPGRARNAGAANGNDSDLLAFVDADCVLPRGWLRHGMEHFSQQQVVAVGSVQATAPADAPWVERVWLESVLPKANTPWQRVSWLPAFNLLVRKADFDALRGFDETLTTCEDSDLSFRLARKGELRRDHRHPVQHLGESKSLPEFFRREMWRSRGNFRSAWQRRSVAAEFTSLFLPLSYVLLLMLVPVAFIVALTVGGWWLAVACVVACVLVIPIGIAFAKRKRLIGCGPASLLFATYLLARGLGPFWPARRVARH